MDHHERSDGMFRPISPLESKPATPADDLLCFETLEGEEILSETPTLAVKETSPEELQKPATSPPTDNVPPREPPKPLPTSPVQHILPDLLRNQLEAEERDQHRVEHDYLGKMRHNIRPFLRSQVLEMMLNLGDDFRLERETTLLSVQILDRFLARRMVRRSSLTVLVSACLLVASKYLEVSQHAPAISVHDLTFRAQGDFTVADLRAMEMSVLDALSWNVSFPNPFGFLRPLAQLRGVSVEVAEKAATFTALGSPNYPLVGFRASVIACASLMLASAYVGSDEDDLLVCMYEGVDLGQVLACCGELIRIVESFCPNLNKCRNMMRRISRLEARVAPREQGSQGTPAESAPASNPDVEVASATSRKRKAAFSDHNLRHTASPATVLPIP